MSDEEDIIGDSGIDETDFDRIVCPNKSRMSRWIAAIAVARDRCGDHIECDRALHEIHAYFNEAIKRLKY